jgi:mandelamide amidase
VDEAVSQQRLLAAARQLNAIACADEAVFSPDTRPCLLVKDNIAVAGMPWTAGTPLLADMLARRDAMAVRLLRTEGAAVAAKTTLHELAFGVTGANGWTGAIANPYGTGRMAGGSSGGSAAALALGLSDLSLVTDTGGSARVPAAHCGIIGFRPSTGRYPLDGVIGLSPSRDTIGLMARGLDWICWADDILAGRQPAAPSLPATPRVGILPDAALAATDPAVATAYRTLTTLLDGAGWTLAEVDIEPILAIDEACGFAIALHETHQSLLASIPGLCGRSFDDLLAAVATPDVADMLRLAAGQEAVTPAAYADAIGRGWPRLRAAYAALFAGGIDLILTPTTPLTAPPIGQGDNLILNGRIEPTFATYTRYTRPDSMAGLPSISLPFGHDAEGMPIGMMISAPRFADRALLAAAESAMGLTGWPAPSCPPIHA